MYRMCQSQTDTSSVLGVFLFLNKQFVAANQTFFVYLISLFVSVFFLLSYLY